MGKIQAYLKQKMKRHIPEKYRRKLDQPREQLSANFANLLYGVLRLFPLSVVAGVKEKIKCTGRMDYPRRDIYMRVDSLVQRNRLFACQKEPETVDWIETHCKAGDVFYDIGANVGAYSFVAYAVMAGDCTVYSFEPSFSTFMALSHNVLLNRCQEKIIPFQIVLSDVTKLISFNYSDATPGAAAHSIGDVINEEVQPAQPAFSQRVLSYRLDDLIHQFGLRMPNHIKIDVDGSELDILCGAAEVLAYLDLRSVLIEVDEKKYPNEEIQKLMMRNGFFVRSRHFRINTNTTANYIFEKGGRK